jgi:hypothetical protein
MIHPYMEDHWAIMAIMTTLDTTHRVQPRHIFTYVTVIEAPQSWRKSIIKLMPIGKSDVSHLDAGIAASAPFGLARNLVTETMLPIDSSP